MGQYSSYYLYQRYEKRGDQDWIPCYPNVYSVDGNGTMTPYVKIENDEACGWRCFPEYKWEDVPVTEEYECDECEIDIEFRWVSTSAYTYFGDYKYEVLQEQFRKDKGEWVDTTNTKYSSTGEVAEKKVKVTMSDGTVFSQSCGDDSGVWHSYPDKTALYSETAIQHWTNVGSGCSAVLTDPENAVANVLTNPPNWYFYVKKVEFGDCVTEIGGRYRTLENNTRSYWDDDVTESGDRPLNRDFRLYSNLWAEEIVLPPNLRWIGDGALNGNKITSITLPSTVESIGYLRWFDQPSPSSSYVNRLEGSVLSDNPFLKSVTLNEGLKSIGSGAFSRNYSLQRIVIPESVEKIADNIFSGCTNLLQIVFNSQTPPSLICNADSIYYDYSGECSSRRPNLAVNNQVTIYVPCGSKEAYDSYLGRNISTSRIVEYGGSCGDVPSLESLTKSVTYKVGDNTTTIYRKNDYATISNNSLPVTVFSGADEVTLYGWTFTGSTEITIPTCGKLTLKDCNIAQVAVTDADEVVVDGGTITAMIRITDRTRKMTFNGDENSTMQLRGPRDGQGLEEIWIESPAEIYPYTFSGNTNIKDVYLTADSTIQALSTSNNYYQFYNSDPVIHVPCDRYNKYMLDTFWKTQDIVKIDDNCEEDEILFQVLNSDGTWEDRTPPLSGSVCVAYTNYYTVKVKGSEFEISVNSEKPYGYVNYTEVYVDGVKVANRGDNWSGTPVYYEDIYKTVATIPNDGEEHIIQINSVRGYSINNFCNKFKIYPVTE